MSNTRYLEIASDYRDRTQFPNPSQFNVLIGQSGTRYRFNAYDPISINAPVVEWTPDNIFGGVNGTVTANLANTEDTFLVCFPPPPPAIPPILINTTLDYYKGLTINIGMFPPATIIGSEYQSTNATGDCFWITVSPSLGSIPVAVTTSVIPMQTFDTTNGIFWVPESFFADSIYTGCFLWNDTTRTGFPIVWYDGATHTVGLDLSDPAVSTAVAAWSVPPALPAAHAR